MPIPLPIDASAIWTQMCAALRNSLLLLAIPRSRYGWWKYSSITPGVNWHQGLGHVPGGGPFTSAGHMSSSLRTAGCAADKCLRICAVPSAGSFLRWRPHRGIACTALCLLVGYGMLCATPHLSTPLILVPGTTSLPQAAASSAPRRLANATASAALQRASLAASLAACTATLAWLALMWTNTDGLARRATPPPLADPLRGAAAGPAAAVERHPGAPAAAEEGTVPASAAAVERPPGAPAAADAATAPTPEGSAGSLGECRRRALASLASDDSSSSAPSDYGPDAVLGPGGLPVPFPRSDDWLGPEPGQLPAGFRRGVLFHNTPPWNPAWRTWYPFRDWVGDVLTWVTLRQDLTPAQMAESLATSLQGEAGFVASTLSSEELARGGQINGVMQDPVTYLLLALVPDFASATDADEMLFRSELFTFRRRWGERIEDLIERFENIRYSYLGAGGPQLPYQAYSWLLLSAANYSPARLRTALIPFGARGYPSSAVEYHVLRHTMIHIPDFNARYGRPAGSVPPGDDAALAYAEPLPGWPERTPSGPSAAPSVSGQSAASGPLPAPSAAGQNAGSGSSPAPSVADQSVVSVPLAAPAPVGRSPYLFSDTESVPASSTVTIAPSSAAAPGAPTAALGQPPSQVLMAPTTRRLGWRAGPTGAPAGTSDTDSRWQSPSTSPDALMDRTERGRSRPVFRARLHSADGAAGTIYTAATEADAANPVAPATTPAETASASAVPDPPTGAPAPADVAEAAGAMLAALVGGRAAPRGGGGGNRTYYAEYTHLADEERGLRPGRWRRPSREAPAPDHWPLPVQFRYLDLASTMTYDSQAGILAMPAIPMALARPASAPSEQPLAAVGQNATSSDGYDARTGTYQEPGSPPLEVPPLLPPGLPPPSVPPMTVAEQVLGHPLSPEDHEHGRAARAAAMIGMITAPAGGAPPPPVPWTSPAPAHEALQMPSTCTVCYADLEPGDDIYTVSCGHRYHRRCLLDWSRHTQSHWIVRAASPTPNIFEHCPNCVLIDVRTPLRIEDLERTTARLHLPWWPAGGPPLSQTSSAAGSRSSTQLPGGQISLIVDTGAWTNLLGADLASKLILRASGAGYSPMMQPLARPLDVQGIGSGAQQCTQELVTPVAITDSRGRAQVHRLTAPVVRGCQGRTLPGLLGLRSMEQLGAVLDLSQGVLSMRGVTFPLRKAPSDHLVLVIDDYEDVSTESEVIETALPSLLLQARAEPLADEASPDAAAAAADAGPQPHRLGRLVSRADGTVARVSRSPHRTHRARPDQIFYRQDRMSNPRWHTPVVAPSDDGSTTM